MAENRLIAMKKPYSKGDIDAQAAAIILEDYMEVTYGH
jgi:RNase H-fold protein (predicted Holliday junction resolvase)